MASVQGRRGAYRVFWREGGKQRTSSTFESKVDAEAHLREIEETRGNERRQSGPVLPSTPIKSLLDRWKTSRLSSRRARGPFMDEACAHIKAIIEDMGRGTEETNWGTIRNLTAEGIDRWRGKRKEGRGTDKPLQCLKAFLRWCRRVAKLRIDTDILDLEERRVKRRAQPPRLTDAQVALILTESLSHGLSVGVAIEHLVLYGCRPIDIARAKVKDWDTTARVITYRDTKNIDDISHPVHAAHGLKLDELCKDQEGGPRDPDAHLFLDPWGRPWRITKLGQAEGLSSWYKTNIGEKLGPNDRRWAKGVPPKTASASRGGTVLAKDQRGIYMLKDYALSRLAAASNGDRRAVSTISGHRSLSVIDRYLATNSQEQHALLGAVPMPVTESARSAPLDPKSIREAEVLPPVGGSPSPAAETDPSPN